MLQHMGEEYQLNIKVKPASRGDPVNDDENKLDPLPFVASMRNLYKIAGSRPDIEHDSFAPSDAVLIWTSIAELESDTFAFACPGTREYSIVYAVIMPFWF